MKVFKAKEIRDWDKYTINNEPIASIQLMERAAHVFTHQFIHDYPDNNLDVVIICGTGNNGGDGLVIGRLLSNAGYPVSIYHISFNSHQSEEFKQNLIKLPRRQGVKLIEIKGKDEIQRIEIKNIAIDAIFGTGLSRPLNDEWNDLIRHINNSAKISVSVDIPSGLSADMTLKNEIVHSHRTYTFQIPKLSMLIDENQKYTGLWKILDIGLHKNFINSIHSDFHFVDYEMVKNFIKKRKSTDHKGSFGHALIVAGGKGKIGAAILSARSCMRSGTGLVTVHTPKQGTIALHSSCPELMLEIDEDENLITSINKSNHSYSAIGIGCGIGTLPPTHKALKKLLNHNQDPVVLDADALNIIANDRDMLSHIPINSILTPHPKEFDRLFDPIADPIKRMEYQIECSKKFQFYIVYKGHFTRITTPKGQVFFNSTGNHGMATAGSGDVLMGMITGLLAQGYPSDEAAILGVYLHGLAGDIAAEQYGHHSMIASDIIKSFGNAFKTIIG